MADSLSHFAQARKNLQVLEGLNSTVRDSIDWQTTICFYTAVHLVNGHLASQMNLHFQTHTDVDRVINPYSNSPLKFDEALYTSYSKLSNLSRRARYLCNDQDGSRQKDAEKAFHLKDIHLAKAIKNLQAIISHFDKIYGIGLTPISIICKEFSVNTMLDNFHINVVKSPQS